MKRLQAPRGYLAKHVNWLLALLLIMVLAQPDASYRNGRVAITLGPPEAYAAGTADYSLDGLADDVEVIAALNALPNQGGLLHFKAGTYNLTANVTRAIGNVTIEGEGRNTLFTGSGSFVAGGNQWVFRDLALNATTQVDMGATTGWSWVNIYDQATLWNSRVQSGQVVFVTANGTTLFVTSLNSTTVNATQLTGATGNLTTAFITSGNITSANMSSLNMSGDILPTSNNTRSLGSTLVRWLTGWFVNLVSETGNITFLNTPNATFTDNGTAYFVDPVGTHRLMFHDYSASYGSSSSLYIGLSAGNDSDARWNTGVGVGALQYGNSTAEANVAIGSATLAGNPFSGIFNTAIGDGAGQFATTANYSVFLGDHTGNGNPHRGISNSWVGSAAGTVATTGSYNVALGARAGVALTIADSNVLLGYQAGKDITSGTGNVLIGYDTGDSITTGGSNIRIGGNAGDGMGATDSRLAIGVSGGNSTTEYLYGEMGTNPTILRLNARASTSGVPITNGQFIIGGNYWNGVNSVAWPFSVLHEMTSNVTPSSNVTFSINSISLLQLENINGTAGIYISSNGTLKRVYEGAADTGGTGYKTLIVPN